MLRGCGTEAHMGKLIELVASTFETFGVLGVCTVVGGLVLVVVIKVASGK